MICLCDEIENCEKYKIQKFIGAHTTILRIDDGNPKKLVANKRKRMSNLLC